MPRLLSQHPDAVRSRARRAAAKARIPAAAQASERASPEQVHTRHLDDVRRVRQARRSRMLPSRNLLEGGGWTLESIASYRPPPIKNPWRPCPCSFCGAKLLMAEDITWCCNRGRTVLKPLPPLTSGIASLLSNPPTRRRTCEASRSLNNLFCLSALGVSEKWTEYKGMSCHITSIPSLISPCHRKHILNHRRRFLACHARLHIPPCLPHGL